MKPFLLSIVGRKGSGKSEVLEVLIASLKEKGLRVGVMKHLAREDFEIDQPGKDTYRYRLWGAETVMLLGKKKRAIFSDLPIESDWEENLKYFEDFDLVFMEGYFLKTVPMIEVYNSEKEKPLLMG
ncbi:MAG: molybdopterin-guanine dinucleotide biosynthesis protein B, partial [Candidatus Omnitrophica bacterium]|nr:molybdopterin-guanine dinucleotide biosynthesis protein B [Candidatus Omnitrophota bacterium]